MSLSNDEPVYSFRPVTAVDLPMLSTWLNTQAVAEWWPDPDHQLSLIEDDLDDPRMTMVLALVNGAPFAYLQDHDIRDWPEAHYADLPIGARSIDLFAGALLGKGHAATALQLRVADLLTAGVPVVAVDPDPENTRAIAAYTNAGFIPRGVVNSDDGSVLVLLAA